MLSTLPCFTDQDALSWHCVVRRDCDQDQRHCCHLWPANTTQIIPSNYSDRLVQYVQISLSRAVSKKCEIYFGNYWYPSQ